MNDQPDPIPTGSSWTEHVKNFFKYWIWAIIWMALIFDASTTVGSPQHTSYIIIPLLRWLKPTITREQMDFIHLLIRKFAHITEYAVLALLLYHALYHSLRGLTARWSWRAAGLTLALCALYGSGDELHQLFVLGRHPSPWDVLIDTIGAAIGLALLRMLHLGIERARAKRRTTPVHATAGQTTS